MLRKDQATRVDQKVMPPPSLRFCCIRQRLENWHGHTLDIHLLTKEIIYWYLYHIFVYDVTSKGPFWTTEIVKICIITNKDDLSRAKWSDLERTVWSHQIAKMQLDIDMNIVISDQWQKKYLFQKQLLFSNKIERRVVKVWNCI